MFTGIIEAIGTVAELTPRASGYRVAIRTDLDLQQVPSGGSIATNGVCLTVVDRSPGRFAADIGPETVAVSTLGTLRVGDRVHLERPLRIGDPLGGHLVSGHVDGVGEIATRRPVGEALELWITAPAEVARYLVPKGSVAVEGASLTVNAVAPDRFSVTLIPHTLHATLLESAAVGRRVNLEADLIAKQIDRAVAVYLGRTDASGAGPARETMMELLGKHGYIR